MNAETNSSSLPMGRRGQLQEDAVLAQDEAFLAGEAVVLLAERVGGEAGAVGLVGGQALDRVDAVGGGGRALVRREVADELGAAARDRLAPVARVGLEQRLFEGVDLVADEAGDHGASGAVAARLEQLSRSPCFASRRSVAALPHPAR